MSIPYLLLLIAEFS